MIGRSNNSSDLLPKVLNYQLDFRYTNVRSTCRAAAYLNKAFRRSAAPSVFRNPHRAAAPGECCR